MYSLGYAFSLNKGPLKYVKDEEGHGKSICFTYVSSLLLFTKFGMLIL